MKMYSYEGEVVAWWAICALVPIAILLDNTIGMVAWAIVIPIIFLLLCYIYVSEDRR